MKNCIKELRKARGLRQEDMAHLLGVSAGGNNALCHIRQKGARKSGNFISYTLALGAAIWYDRKA